jgi:transaldolase
MTTIQRLRQIGQSVWLDYLDRTLVTSGRLDRMIADAGLAGMTSNPTIFQKAIAASDAYDDTIRAAPASESDARVFERIAVGDVAIACDKFRPLFEERRGSDGYVSIEVSPELAHDTTATIAEVHRLWNAVSRPNVMVKIPGTREGLEAIERCLADGINVNVTLLFAVSRYVEVVESFMRGLERRASRGEALHGIASVASFFVSRIDTKVDKALDALTGPSHELGRPLRGQVAIANAAVAYDEYRRLFAADRWSSLAAKGARTQRVLWASTSTKDPTLPDLHYADALVAPGTVDTMTLDTFRAYVDHGRTESHLPESIAEARERLAALERLGVKLDAVTAQLEDEGVHAFAESHAKALLSIADKRRNLARVSEASRRV